MLKKFQKLHREKRPERFGDDGAAAGGAEEWFFHQDNAPVIMFNLRFLKSVSKQLTSSLFPIPGSQERGDDAVAQRGGLEAPHAVPVQPRPRAL